MQSSKPTQIEKIAAIQNEKRGAISFGVFTLVVVLVLVGGAITPSVSSIISLQSEISAKEEMYAKLDEKIVALSDLSQQYDSLSDTVKDLPLYFPANKDMSFIAVNIDEVCQEHEYVLRSISFPSSDSTDGEGEMLTLVPQYVTLSIQGKPAGLIELLDSFEEMPMYPEIERVNYTATADNEGNYDYTVQLKVYRIDDELFYE